MSWIRRSIPFSCWTIPAPDISPDEHPRGVGEHPHRGIWETVTIM